jgi:protein gp37
MTESEDGAVGASRIEWCNFVFNPWIGCAHASSGCINCYAEEEQDRRYHRVRWGKDGTRHKTSAAYWKQPAKWDREARESGQRKRVFCASLADVCEDRDELAPWRRELLEVIEATEWLDWLMLTKRPENAPEMLGETARKVWVGASVENQKALEHRLSLLQMVEAKGRFLSAEPMLEGLDLGTLPGIDWVIVGGESGLMARQCRREWLRAIAYQCERASVPCFIKQFGANVRCSECLGEGGHTPLNGMIDGSQCSACGGSGRMRLRDPKGGDPTEWPADMRIRDFPNF